MEVTADDDDIKWSCVRWKVHRKREPPEFTPMGTKKKAFIVGGVVGEEARVTSTMSRKKKGKKKKKLRLTLPREKKIKKNKT